MEYKEDNVYIFWIESKFNIQKQIMLGFNEKDKPPLFAYFDPSLKKKSILPPHTPLTQKKVANFIE